ncbi:MAG: ABC transporter permease subunit [Synergistaceae bacterium]|jgi:NitT/TauT family transport system permease protein|nr:ABC transporter permease subunit [Synergistaceae bacterium]
MKRSSRVLFNSCSIWKLFAVLPYAAALALNILIPPVIEVDELPFRALLAVLTVYFGARCLFSLRGGPRAEAFGRGARFYGAVGVLFMVWDVLSSKTGVLPLPFFPGPAQIMEVIFRERGVHAMNCLYSLRLFAAGFAAGTLCGSVSGILIGWSDRWHYWLFPVMKVAGVIPAIALVPLVLIVMPDTFSTAVTLVALSAWFPVAFTTARGIHSIDRTYFEAARILGANDFYMLRKIAIPGAVPAIFTGISTATGIAFSTLVVSEMIGARGGLGYYINLAMGWMNYASVYAAIVIMAILFISVLTAINGIKNRLLIWQKGLVK